MKALYNARIHTLDKAAPLASVIVIDHGEVVAVGGDELLGLFDRADKQDLQGYTVLPGSLTRICTCSIMRCHCRKLIARRIPSKNVCSV